MKNISTNTKRWCVFFVIIFTGDATAGWKDVLDSAKKSTSSGSAPGQSSPSASTSSASQAGSLTDLLVKKTGVTAAQAEGGAGTLFQMAKSKMQSAAFSKLEQSVPGMQGLLSTASAIKQPSLLGSASSGLSSVTGGTAGNLVSLASAFQQQGMSPQMVQQFIPIIVDYVKSSGGNAVASSLSSVFTGL
jgi:Protein of unknown function VcgC/VcgE (DUF2780)